MLAVLINSLSAAPLCPTGVASNDGNACRTGGFCHAGLRLSVSIGNHLEDEATGEIMNCATDRNVIGGAANRQLADITARKEQRVNA